MIHFDTLEYAKTLETAGVSKIQAEAFAKAQQKALSDCLDTTLATKADVASIRSEVQEIKTGLYTEIQEVKIELHNEIHAVKIDVLTLESKVNIHSWMLSALLAGVGSLVLKTFF